MSLLNYIVTDDQVLVITDTQITSSEDKTAMGYGEKAFLIPSRRMIIAATGRVDVFQRWLFNIFNNPNLDTVEGLLENGPDSLQEIQTECNEQHYFEVDSSIYNFVKIDGRFTCIVFRSSDNWAHNLQNNCIGLKPDYTEELPEREDNESDSDYIYRMAFIQKEIDDKKGIDKVGIGGELIQYYMKTDAYSINILKEL